MTEVAAVLAVLGACCAAFSFGVALGARATGNAVRTALSKPYAAIDAKHPDDRVQLED